MTGAWVEAERLAGVVAEIRQPPRVGVYVFEQRTTGVLLCWGRHPVAGWVGGVAVLMTQRHRRELLTLWLPGHLLRPTAPDRYAVVPRTALRGRADQWPALPAIYPGASPEWQQRHRHVVYRPEPGR